MIKKIYEGTCIMYVLCGHILLLLFPHLTFNMCTQLLAARLK